MSFEEIFSKAQAAGREAGQACNPTAVAFQSSNDLFATGVDFSQPYEVVADGVCGFAWVDVYEPKNSPFAKFLLSRKLASPRDGKGVSIWIRDYNQSMQRKEAHAEAMAKVLQDAGFRAYAGSRMD